MKAIGTIMEFSCLTGGVPLQVELGLEYIGFLASMEESRVITVFFTPIVNCRSSPGLPQRSHMICNNIILEIFRDDPRDFWGPWVYYGWIL